MTRQRARVGCTAVCDGVTPIGRHNVQVKIDQPLARNSIALTANSVRGVAGGACESIINMPRVFAEAGVRENLAQVMAFGTQGIRPVDGQVRIREQVHDASTGRRRLAEFTTPLEQVGEFRAMGSVCAVAAKLAIVVTVVAVGAENAIAYVAARSGPIEI